MIAYAHSPMSIIQTHHIYCKTDKGRFAIEQRAFGLQARQRSLLIMIDCTRALRELVTVLPTNELKTNITFLLDQDLIITKEAFHKTTSIPVAPIAINTPDPPQLVEIDAAALSAIKQYMIETARLHLGLMSTDIANRLNRCHTNEQLLNAAAHWHMALRESPSCQKLAGQYLDEVKARLMASQT